MRKLKVKFRLPIVLLAATFLLIFLHYLHFLSPLENMIVKLLGPVQNAFYSLSEMANSEDAESKRVRQLVIENERLKLLLSEYEAYANQITFINERDLTHINGKVLTREISGEFQGLIINIGSSDGVRRGLPVLIENGILIGKIAEVKKDFSKVILLTDANSQTAAALSNIDETVGIVSGEADINMKMELIPKERDMNIDDIVVTSGLESSIPRGLVIGRVARIDNPAGGFFKTAYLEALVSLDKVDVVSVLILPYDS